MAGVPTHDVHVNASQLRLDHWTRISQASVRLSEGPAPASEQLLRDVVEHSLDTVDPWERYFAFPGPQLVTTVRRRLASRDYELLAAEMDRLSALLSRLGDGAAILREAFDLTADIGGLLELAKRQHYFTVLVVDSMSHRQMRDVRRDLRAARNIDDEFVFELLPVASLEDALVAVMTNPQIQAVWVRGDVALRSDQSLPYFRKRVDELAQLESGGVVQRYGSVLGALIRDRRPELDLYLTLDAAGQAADPRDRHVFNRLFYRKEHPAEIHMTTLDGVRRRYRTPFFDALREYARRPIGNFHALPIARGNSVFNSDWIQDMGEFYGDHIFMAETSSTMSGLDSLLAPTGSLKEAQDAASRAFGSKQTFFATNGTSSSNKIVVQALCKPGDIVLIDRDCHKSHHYGLALSGALPVYLDAYAMPEYGMYGGVPLREIKRQLLALKRAGRLDQVRMLLLTNCTFDGIVYDPGRVMREVLAIHPGIVFLWDEAWYAYAQLHPTSRERSAMRSARRLRQMLDSSEYRSRYAEWRAAFDQLDPDDDSTWLDTELLPDPDSTRVRAYATQSTHKSLSSLRQGSMIHEWDELFQSEVDETFHEAYFTHTTTSPNYQILASLDLARRQVELEGFADISDAMQMAFFARNRVRTDPLLSKYFRFLDPEDMIPPEYRPSGLSTYSDLAGTSGFADVVDSYKMDEFVLDPTRLTLFTAATGMNGDEFKLRALMDRFGIQVNKTATNSVLLMTNIGTTWSSVDYLLNALRSIALTLEQQHLDSSPAELQLFSTRVDQLTKDLPPLPDFSAFHDVFRPSPETPEGNMRSAYFLAYSGEAQEYIPLGLARELLAEGRELVSSKFIIPYPPGFPILVPGQLIRDDVVEFMERLAITEIHGYRPELGLPVFTEAAIASVDRSPE